jgi:hypothetical protein
VREVHILGGFPSNIYLVGTREQRRVVRAALGGRQNKASWRTRGGRAVPFRPTKPPESPGLFTQTHGRAAQAALHLRTTDRNWDRVAVGAIIRRDRSLV